MQLGEKFIELTEYLAPRGRPFPIDSRSNDRWFQHMAIIASDMDKAYHWLRQHKVEHASSGPQRLPDYLSPRDGPSMPLDEKANEFIHWQTLLMRRDTDTIAQSLRTRKFSFVSPGIIRTPDKNLGFQKGFLARDQDDHLMAVIEETSPLPLKV